VLRGPLGLDDFEGCSWRGFHHHACLVMVAYGFLLWEKRQGAAGPCKNAAPGNELGAAFWF
jgi:SRSO17 transposase